MSGRDGVFIIKIPASGQKKALGYLAKIIIIALAYHITGRLGLFLAVPPGYATAIWPPSGVALAALLCLGSGAWPGVFLGSFTLNLFVSFDPTDQSTIILSGAMAAFIAGGATLQALAGAWLVRRFIEIPNTLEQTKSIVLLVLLGGPVGCLINATASVTMLAFAGAVPWQNYGFNWVTWWVGDSIGVMIFTPILLLILSPLKTISQRRKIIVSAALSAAFLLTVCIFFAASKTEQKSQNISLEREAENIHAQITNSLRSYRDISFSLEGLYAASEKVTAQEFGTFVRKLLIEYPGIHGVGWAQSVPKSERAAFEQSMINAGHAGFKIWERGENGAVVPARERDQYFSVMYGEPAATTGKSIGYDLYVEDQRRAALDQARDSGEIVATSRVNLVQDNNKNYAFILFNPVYEYTDGKINRAKLKGYIGTGFLFPEMLKDSEAIAKNRNISFILTDNTNPAAPETLYDSRTPDHKENTSTEKSPPADITTPAKTIPAFGRNWVVQIFPTTAYIAAHHNWSVWWILTSGLVSTGIFGAFLLLGTGRADNIQRLIEERTLQLHIAKETFRSAMAHAPIGKALVAPDGKWLEVNDAICALLGYSAAELLTMDFQKVTHPDDLGEDLELLQKMLTGEIQTYTLEKRYFHKDGRMIWALLSVSLVWNVDKTPKYFISQIQNITQLKEAEKQRDTLIRKLAESNVELEQFAYVASHDLQEPLRMIVNYSQLIDDDYGNALGKDARDYLDIVIDSAKRMMAMVNDLLDYARVSHDEKRFSLVPVNNVLADVLENLTVSTAEHHAKITHDALPIVMGNPLQLTSLLQNLLSNSLKYQRDGVESIIHVAAEEHNAHWKFSIRDNGIGIPEEFITKIFEPFKKLHNQQDYKGTGIGLALCKKIVENHGGEIWATSRIGEGSIFYFTLPKTT